MQMAVCRYILTGEQYDDDEIWSFFIVDISTLDLRYKASVLVWFKSSLRAALAAAATLTSGR
jgi:hypothetical protein